MGSSISLPSTLTSPAPSAVGIRGILVLELPSPVGMVGGLPVRVGLLVEEDGLLDELVDVRRVVLGGRDVLVGLVEELLLVVLLELEVVVTGFELVVVLLVMLVLPPSVRRVGVGVSGTLVVGSTPAVKSALPWPF